jgi:hypothetical protein
LGGDYDRDAQSKQIGAIESRDLQAGLLVVLLDAK